MSSAGNFCIIAHIDHGKSTVCDRLLQFGGLKIEANSQFLDQLEVERARGITIKAQTCSFVVPGVLRAAPGSDEGGDGGDEENDIFKNTTGYQQELERRSTEKGDFVLNLIDTPGHVDFSYEVSRSLACCQAAVLLVDVLQGVQAQTVSTSTSRSSATSPSSAP